MSIGSEIIRTINIETDRILTSDQLITYTFLFPLIRSFEIILILMCLRVCIINFIFLQHIIISNTGIFFGPLIRMRERERWMRRRIVIK